MAPASSIIRRALLYVPGSSQKMLEKSRGLTVDCVAYDLEDSVTPGMKATARKNIRSILDRPQAEGIREQAVRINSVDSGLALEDLTEVVNSASDLHFITDVLRHTLPHRHPGTISSPTTISAPPVRIIALIESASAVTSLSTICKASPYLSGLIFAAEDFALDLSLTRTPSLTEFLYARSAIVTHARAHSLPSAIDLVCTAYAGPEGVKTLEEECKNGTSMGFNGKQCIHPSQVEVVQRVFAASPKDVEWAVRVVIANEKAESAGRGAWSLEGKMIDRPVVGKAEAIVRRAEREGIVDMAVVRDKWKGQKPE